MLELSSDLVMTFAGSSASGYLTIYEFRALQPFMIENLIDFLATIEGRIEESMVSLDDVGSGNPCNGSDCVCPTHIVVKAFIDQSLRIVLAKNLSGYDQGRWCLHVVTACQEMIHHFLIDSAICCVSALMIFVEVI
jgi:hypothetical protein